MVVAAVHQEARARRDGAEAADDQPVLDEIEVVAHLGFEVGRVVEGVVVAVVADLDVRMTHDVLQKHHRALIRDRKHGVGIGDKRHGCDLSGVRRW